MAMPPKIELTGPHEDAGLEYRVSIAVREVTDANRHPFDGPEDRYEVACEYNGQPWDRTASETLAGAKAVAREWACVWKATFRENAKVRA